jgi:hypothetical protein
MISMTRSFIKSILMLALAVLLVPAGFVAAVPSSSWEISGQVIDMKGEPIVGASVIVYEKDRILTGAPTGQNGEFALKIKSPVDDTLTVKVTSIGYTGKDALLAPGSFDTPLVLNFKLERKTIVVDAIEVKPEKERPASEVSFDREEITQAATRSLVPTNPVSAIKNPQVVREGSNHSSKLRVNGTSPKYYINGVEIGANPNHYGVFAVIPASVIKEMTFRPHGTDARLGSPAAVEFDTGLPFERHFRGELSLSFIDATGAFSYGNPRFFVQGSLRKSVLDKLVNRFDLRSDRRTLPPTNFQDVFVSSGAKLSGRHYLLLDQYHVQDFLAFNTGATARNPQGINTFLHTKERYFGLRWNAVYPNVLVKASAALRLSKELYLASVVDDDPDGAVRLDLTAVRRAGLGKIELSFPMTNGLVTLGDEVEYVFRRQVDMVQHNWNFLPPDANSDNPFLYQPELNQLYETYSGRRRDLRNAAYVSVSRSFRGFQVETGLRGEYFEGLNDGTVLLWRQRLTVATGENSRVGLFVGTFAEAPAAKILEPYQVLIHADYERLKPVKTKLAAADLTVGRIKFGLFAKRTENLPTPVPDFAWVGENGVAEDGFIAVRPESRVDFYGGDVTLDLDGWLSQRLDLQAFYGYTYARKAIDGLTVPYELNAPHKFYAQAAYRLNRLVTFGGELSLRSGFAYTPTRSESFYTQGELIPLSSERDSECAREL